MSDIWMSGVMFKINQYFSQEYIKKGYMVKKFQKIFKAIGAIIIILWRHQTVAKALKIEVDNLYKKAVKKNASICLRAIFI